MNLNRFLKFIGASALAVCSILGSSGVTVSAEGNGYTPVAGGSVDFKKYLVVDSEATVPTTSFSFTIEPGTAIPASEGKTAVYAGIGNPTIASVNFTQSDSKYDTVQDGDILTLEDGKSYAKKMTSIVLTGVNFPEPGIYRYKISETTSTPSIITMDDATNRYLDVFVVDNNGALEVSSYVLHKSADDIPAGSEMGTAGTPIADKSDGFVNEYLSKDLEFGKEVTGNQGSKDKYFDFTLTITGAQASSNYTVDISKADATSGTNAATIDANSNKQNPTTVTTDANGSVTVHYYLADGQYVKVLGLPKGATYSVTENAEDYKSTQGITAEVSGGDAHTDAVSGTIADANISTGYTNTRNGVIPTGVALSVMGGAVLLAIGAAGLILSKRKRTF